MVNLDQVFQVQQPRMFSYGPYGIIRDETIVSDGYIYFPILIKTTHADYVKVKKNDDGSLPFDFHIVNSGSFDIFNSSYLKRDSNGEIEGNYSANNTGFSNGCTNPFTCEIHTNKITASFSLISNDFSLDNDVFFNAAFHFEFDDYSTVYSNLASTGLSFSINVKADVL